MLLEKYLGLATAGEDLSDYVRVVVQASALTLFRCLVRHGSVTLAQFALAQVLILSEETQIFFVVHLLILEGDSLG